jgi:hypothetical protein
LRRGDIRKIDPDRKKDSVAVLGKFCNEPFEVPAEGLQTEKSDILMDGKQLGNRPDVLSNTREEIGLGDARLSRFRRGDVVALGSVEIAHERREGRLDRATSRLLKKWESGRRAEISACPFA